MEEIKSTNQMIIKTQSTSVGECAIELLKSEYFAYVIGVTSRGVFIKIEEKFIIFLSDEPFSGPLTINLHKTFNQWHRFKVNQPVELSYNLLSIPSAKTQVGIDHSMIRKRSTPRISSVSPEKWKANLELLVNSALEMEYLSTMSAHLLSLLPAWKTNYFLESLNHQSNELTQIIDAIKSGSTMAFVHSLYQFFGKGMGLTPSGDDFILGVTLLINRWFHVLDLSIDLSFYNRMMIDLAYQNTTLLSANLIACATKGKADERIEALADTIFSEKLPDENAVLSWLNWGATSGVDALLGMGTMIVSHSDGE